MRLLSTASLVSLRRPPAKLLAQAQEERSWISPASQSGGGSRSTDTLRPAGAGADGALSPPVTLAPAAAAGPCPGTGAGPGAGTGATSAAAGGDGVVRPRRLPRAGTASGHGRGTIGRSGTVRESSLGRRSRLARLARSAGRAHRLITVAARAVAAAAASAESATAAGSSLAAQPGSDAAAVDGADSSRSGHSVRRVGVAILLGGGSVASARELWVAALPRCGGRLDSGATTRLLEVARRKTGAAAVALSAGAAMAPAGRSGSRQVPLRVLVGIQSDSSRNAPLVDPPAAHRAESGYACYADPCARSSEVLGAVAATGTADSELRRACGPWAAAAAAVSASGGRLRAQPRLARACPVIDSGDATRRRPRARAALAAPAELQAVMSLPTRLSSAGALEVSGPGDLLPSPGSCASDAWHWAQVELGGRAAGSEP